MSTRAAIDEAFRRVFAQLDPLTIGNGPAVEQARLAMQSLYLLRQWARGEAGKAPPDEPFDPPNDLPQMSGEPRQRRRKS